MYTNSVSITSKKAKGVTIRAVYGHFVTSHSHINCYVDLTDVKVRHSMAQQAAAALAASYTSININTIICQEGTEMVGAFLADSLSKPNMRAINSGASINVLTPEVNSSGQLIFRENTLDMIRDRNILLLVSSVTTGKTVNRAVDCISYYSGHLIGVCSLFSMVPKIYDMPVNSIFSQGEITNYVSYSNDSCPLCDEKKPIDAMVNSFGFSKIGQ